LVYCKSLKRNISLGKNIYFILSSLALIVISIYIEKNWPDDGLPLPQPPLKFKIDYLYRHKHQFEFKPLTNTATLKSGDLYKIIFTLLEKYYVYIFQTDSKSNNIIQIFPMYKFKGVKLNHSNPVIAAKTYHIPKKNISFILDNNSGTTETIYFIAAREPDVELEQLYKEIKIAQQHDEIIQSKLETSKILQKITQNKTIGEQQYIIKNS